MKFFLKISIHENEPVNIDNKGDISFKILHKGLQTHSERNKWFKSLLKTGKGKYRNVPRKVSDKAKQDLQELEEMMKELESLRYSFTKWVRV